LKWKTVLILEIFKLTSPMYWSSFECCFKISFFFSIKG